jgi:signal peptidase I
MADKQVNPGLQSAGEQNGPAPAAGIQKAPGANRAPPEKAPAAPSPAGQWLASTSTQLTLAAVLILVGALALNMLGFGMRAAILGPVVVVLLAGFFIRPYLPAPAVRTKSAPHGPTDSTREIIETVVFVVVLVLMLKSFAAEAFVIPTGSMAQTLWGYQKVVECPRCKLKFPVNCSQEVDPSEGQPVLIEGCTCPNCRQHIHFIPPDKFEREGPDAEGVWHMKDPGWRSGDRVLVAKFVYDLFNRDPDRLDVVVFKFPGDDTRELFPGSGPVKKQVPMNYIKRYIGAPGETIAIHRGDLYALSPDKGLHYPEDLADVRDNPQLLEQRKKELWRNNDDQHRYMHRDDPKALRRFEAGQFQIIRKNPDNILAMMRLVYDNDHPAEDLKGPDWQRWVSQDKGWQPDGDKAFRGEADEDHTRWVRYRHLLRGRDRPQLITDFLGYNTWESSAHPGAPGENWVRDLILECEVAVEQPGGELTLELSAGVDRFQARFNLGNGLCTLYRLGPGGKPEELGSKQTRLKGKGTYSVRLANVDERLTVWVDGRLPFDDGVVYDPPKDLRPVEKNDLKRPASIGLQGSKVSVRHLKLFRDTYYTTGGRTKDHPPAVSQKDVQGFDAAEPSTWDKLKEAEPATFYVQPGHYLCLGDNSAESSDGRSWGLVPRRLMLGRALLVYYPFDRAGRIR